MRDVRGMKVDFYISSLSSGGAEHVLTNLASNFINNEQDVSIISYEKRPQFYPVDSRVKIHKYNFTKKNKIIEVLSDFISTKKHLKERKADVAVSFLMRCNFMLILAGAFSKTKIIVCDRNNIIQKYSKFVFRITCFLYRFADAVCVQTYKMKSFYPSYLQKKMYVLKNPLDFIQMNNQCEGKTIIQENTIISVGRLEWQKDFITLIQAFKLISEKYPEWILKIFGQGNRKEELEKLIVDLKIQNRVVLCGVTHTPFLEMKKAKIFVLSSLFEGFPNVLCEAMYAGLACISTNCDFGPSELIKDGDNGYLVNIGDVDQMATRIAHLVEDESLRNQLGTKAKNSVECLEINNVCNEWMEMVLNIAENRGL